MILVAGGGIGGLSLAIALARQGRPVRVLERAGQFRQAGAGIQLGPNASAILTRWGVWAGLEPDLVLPTALHIHDGPTGARLASVPVGAAAARYGAPYGVVHRADLQRVLLETARQMPEIEITPGFEITGVSQTATGVSATARSGQSVSGAGLVGADGVRSIVRESLGLGQDLHYSGKTAWRALVEPAAAPADFGGDEIGLWMGTSAHLVHYPVKGGAKLNVVAVIDDDWAHRGWDAPGEAKSLMPHFERWAGPARDLIGSAGAWRKWALAQMAPLPSWGEGAITLLGDAAHPMLPFLAQGGAMAIEDAATLARELARAESTAVAFAAYYEGRAARTARVQAEAARMGTIYHFSGPARLARNLALKAAPANSLLKRMDWLYGPA